MPASVFEGELRPSKKIGFVQCDSSALLRFLHKLLTLGFPRSYITAVLPRHNGNLRSCLSVSVSVFACFCMYANGYFCFCVSIHIFLDFSNKKPVRKAKRCAFIID